MQDKGYRKEKKISSYSDRKVYIVTKAAKKYACKKLKLVGEVVRQEADNLKKYSDKKQYPDLNIVQYIEHFEAANKKKTHVNMFIIMELYDGDLTRLGEISYTNIIYLSLKMLFILKKFEPESVVHRDIKPENIFFRSIRGSKEYYDFYLGDLGLLTQLKTEGNKTVAGTNSYIAPEIVLVKGQLVNWSTKSDIYSLGKTLLELDRRALNTSHNNIYSRIFEHMANHDVNSRPTINKLLDLFEKIFFYINQNLVDIELFHSDGSHIYFESVHSIVMQHYSLNNSINNNNNNNSSGNNNNHIDSSINNNNHNFNNNNNNNNNSSSSNSNIKSIRGDLKPLDIKFNLSDPFEEPFKVIENIQDYNIIFSIHLTDHIYILEKDNNLYLANLLFSCDDINKINRIEHYFKMCNSHPYSTYLVPGLQYHKVALGDSFWNKTPSSRSYKPNIGYVLLSPFHLPTSYNNVLMVPPNVVIQPVLQLNVYFKIVLFAFEILAHEDDPDQLIQFFFNNFNIYNMLFMYTNDATDCDIRLSVLSNIAQIGNYTNCYNETSAPSIFYSDFKSKDIGSQIFDQFVKVLTHNVMSDSCSLVENCSLYSPPFNCMLLMIYEKVILEHKNMVLEFPFTDKYFKRLEVLYKVIGSKRNYSQFNKNIYYILEEPLIVKVTDNSSPISVIVGHDKNISIMVQYKDLNGSKKDGCVDTLNGYLLHDVKSVQVEHGIVYKLIKPTRKFLECYFSRVISESIIVIETKKDYSQLESMFYTMAKNEIKNQIHSIGRGVEYKFEMLLIGDQIFYIDNNNGEFSNKNIIDSITEIYRHVFGEVIGNPNSTPSNNIFFQFNSLSLLYDYSKTIDSGHSKIVYQPSDAYYYLKQNEASSYSTIKIGDQDYGILEFNYIDLVKSLYWNDSKSMILLLENTTTKEKYYCFRKQDKNQLGNNENLTFYQKEPKSSTSINPQFIIQDHNTSYQFFSFSLFKNLKSIEHIFQQESRYRYYYNIIGIRCLLLYIQYLIENPSRESLVVFISSSLISTETRTDEASEYTICFDILYFLKCVFGWILSFSKWDEFLVSFKKNRSLISIYLQINSQFIESDIKWLDIIKTTTNINQYLKMYKVNIIKELTSSVDIVEVEDMFSKGHTKKKYIRKLVGNIDNKVKEYFKHGGLVSEIIKNKNNDIKLYNVTQDDITDLVDIDIFKYQYGMEVDILQELKGEDGIVQLMDYYGDSKLYALLEYYDAVNLSNYQISTPNQLISILKQMCSIFEKLNKRDIIHYDIKEDNILVLKTGDGECDFKLILLDFGTSNKGSIAKKSEATYYTRSGTLGYQAREIYNNTYRSKQLQIDQQTNKFDLFSLGIVLFKYKIQHKDEKLNNLIRRMISIHYDERITFDELIKEVSTL